MQLDVMKALADDLLRHATLPDDTAVFTRLEDNPARLLLEARQRQPHRAGTIAVSQLAAEEDGADAVRDAFAELMAHIARDALPACAVVDHAPLLLIRTSLGWLAGPRPDTRGPAGWPTPIALGHAVRDCLTYIQRFALPFDETTLQRPVLLRGWDPSGWRVVLDSAPGAVALRSAALRPFARFLVEGAAFQTPALEEGMASFQAARRDHLINSGGSGVHPALDLQAELGRPQAFVIFEPAHTLSDGAAYVASHGYLDEHNLPPWDTWVAVVPSPRGELGVAGLLCWVPSWARGHVEDGMAVNPEACLHWAELQGGRVLW